MNPINPSSGKAAEMLALQDKLRTENRPTEGAEPGSVAETQTEQVPAKSLELSASVETALKEADFDQNKVAAMKEAIRSGNYPLDARKVAENFLPLERLL
jgi:flagellar biosynthesis anti-sigma factor FlgM